MSRTYRYCKKCKEAGESCGNIKILTYDVECDILLGVLRNFSDSSSINSITRLMCDLNLDWENITVNYLGGITFRLTEECRVGHSKKYVNCSSKWLYENHRKCCFWEYGRAWFMDKHRGRNRWNKSIVKQKGCRKRMYLWMRHELQSI